MFFDTPHNKSLRWTLDPSSTVADTSAAAASSAVELKGYTFQEAYPSFYGENLGHGFRGRRDRSYGGSRGSRLECASAPCASTLVETRVTDPVQAGIQANRGDV